jgi:hypothetical protein
VAVLGVVGWLQVFGPPRLEHDETELLATVGGEGHWGGVATGKAHCMSLLLDYAVGLVGLAVVADDCFTPE